jgi:aminoglycoside 3-N-acetyltransferase
MSAGIASKMKRRGRGIAGGIIRRLKRTRQKLVRLDQEKILETLRSLKPEQDQPLLVHSSLSSCGYMTRGPATVIAALKTWTGDALLALPTHTWSYPAASELAPIYDYNVTPSLVGTITNYYREQQGVIRSLHPSHSVACSGHNNS